ncbi:PAS domain S-box protein [Babesia caballi]|uniref:PAS domain S-box protein n=1 Tax=Babesia caballi TaxID=5871 RepID=A0AAV4LSA3_BABCB|nr:PAS domain S-box protein [Babesia caballi]
MDAAHPLPAAVARRVCGLVCRCSRPSPAYFLFRRVIPVLVARDPAAGLKLKVFLRLRVPSLGPSPGRATQKAISARLAPARSAFPSVAKITSVRLKKRLHEVAEHELQRLDARLHHVVRHVLGVLQHVVELPLHEPLDGRRVGLDEEVDLEVLVVGAPAVVGAPDRGRAGRLHARVELLPGGVRRRDGDAVLEHPDPLGVEGVVGPVVLQVDVLREPPPLLERLEEPHGRRAVKQRDLPLERPVLVEGVRVRARGHHLQRVRLAVGLADVEDLLEDVHVALREVEVGCGDEGGVPRPCVLQQPVLQDLFALHEGRICEGQLQADLYDTIEPLLVSPVAFTAIRS